MDRLRMVPLATGLTDFEAKVLTAQLGAEGIIWQVRGVVDSVYPFGQIDVLVPSGEIDEARSYLADLGAADGVAIVTDDPAQDEGQPALDSYRNRWWFVAGVMALITTFVFLRMLALG